MYVLDLLVAAEDLICRPIVCVMTNIQLYSQHRKALAARTDK